MKRVYLDDHDVLITPGDWLLCNVWISTSGECFGQGRVCIDTAGTFWVGQGETFVKLKNLCNCLVTKEVFSNIRAAKEMLRPGLEKYLSRRWNIPVEEVHSREAQNA